MVRRALLAFVAPVLAGLLLFACSSDSHGGGETCVGNLCGLGVGNGNLPHADGEGGVDAADAIDGDALGIDGDATGLETDGASEVGDSTADDGG